MVKIGNYVAEKCIEEIPVNFCAFESYFTNTCQDFVELNLNSGDMVGLKTRDVYYGFMLLLLLWCLRDSVWEC